MIRNVFAVFASGDSSSRTYRTQHSFLSCRWDGSSSCLATRREGGGAVNREMGIDRSIVGLATVPVAEDHVLTRPRRSVCLFSAGLPVSFPPRSVVWLGGGETTWPAPAAPQPGCCMLLLISDDMMPSSPHPTYIHTYILTPTELMTLPGGAVTEPAVQSTYLFRSLGTWGARGRRGICMYCSRTLEPSRRMQ